MTKTQITKAAQRDGEAIEAFIAAMRSADEDGALALVEALTQAAREDAVDDVIVELRSEGMKEAAAFIKVNF